MKIKYLELARFEFHDSISYYEIEQKGLGKKFESEIKSSLDRIQKFPNMYEQVKKDIRKCVVNKFPFNILYSIEKENLLIIAIAHHHRKPDYWVDRLTKS